MKFILGEKQNMTQVFQDDGTVYPVTVVKASPNVVTYVKTKDTDGYAAIQVGFGTKSSKRVSKAVKGHVKDLGSFMHIKEFKADGTFEVGQKIEVGTFAVGDEVVVSAISKGKGFQGVVKRHGFHGGPRTHGQKHSEREAGSISGGTRNGGRVPKGMRMAGRMGGDRITVKGLKIVGISPEENIVFVKGAVPGRRGTLVEIISKK
jgi:large subunit ribosomal protein L3